METDPRHRFKIKISDGYCEYEYSLRIKNPEISIRKIYENLCKMYKCEAEEGKLVK